MKPLSGLLVLLMIGSIIFNEIQPEEQAPIQENTYTFTIIDGNAIKANTTPTTPKIQVLASFSYDWDIYTEIAQYPLWDADLMTRIAFCESGFNAHAIGDRNTAHKSYGILQIRNLPSRNYPIETLFDPAENIRIGYDIFLKQGYGAWKNCYRKSL